MSSDRGGFGEQSGDDGPSPNRPTSREELFDLAGLHVLGLLGDEELEREFLDAFDAADPRLQAEILDRQADWATDAAFLSDDSPPSWLRDRSLANRPASAPKPIGAGVGKGGDGGPDLDEEWSGVGGETDGASRVSRPASAPPSPREGIAGGRVRLSSSRDEHASLRRRLVVESELRDAAGWGGRVGAWLWRTAALAFAIGLAVSIWFQARLLEQTSAIADLAVQRGTEEKFRSMLGVEFDRFLSSRVTVVGLVPAGSQGGVATVHVDPVRRDGFLVVIDLPRASGPYALRALRESSEPVTVLPAFEPAGSLAGFRLPDLSEVAGGLGRWEILDAGGEVVLRSP
jgi:hypothetical protein